MSNSMDIKGIIFDYGGTLDTNGDHWSHIIRKGWDEAGIAADDALFREAYVFGEKELERTSLILPKHNFQDLLNIKIQLELQFLAQTGNFPPAQIEDKAALVAAYCYNVAKQNSEKVKPILDALSKNYPLVMISNFYGNLITVLEDFGLKSYFKEIIDSTVIGIRKPDPKIIESGIKTLGLKPQEVLIIGDSYKNDIAPAKALGCQVILLKGKKWEDEDLSAEDVKAINSLDEILSFLESADSQL